MNSTKCYRLNSISVVDVIGADADKIVHNLTTNEMKSLEVGSGCETFVTNVKGKTLGHVMIYRCQQHLRLIGAGGQSQQIADHADRYTIVEDATPTIRDDEFVAFVVPPTATSALGEVRFDDGDLLCETTLDQLGAVAYGACWLGEGTQVLLASKQHTTRTEQKLIEASCVICDENDFHWQRTIQGFPWYGVDFDDKNLPQEVDRDQAAVSFTKGCYLGQETVARLDAMGQVQKKLVRWSIHGGVPEPGTQLSADDKIVARLTSVATMNENEAVAIGMTRRSHFDAGQRATGRLGTSAELNAVVL